MPRSADFEKIYQAFKENPDYSKDPENPKYFEKLYYAWLKKNDYDDTKPMPKEALNLSSANSTLPTVSEKFEWAIPIEPYLKAHERRIRGEAIHAGESKKLLPKEKRVHYTHDELLRAARTLEGMPIKINHGELLWHDNVEDVGVIDAAEPTQDGEAIEYFGHIFFDDLYEKVRDQTIKSGSIKATVRKFEWLDGISPKGLHFIEFSLIMPPELSGDEKATVEVWESMNNFFIGTSHSADRVGGNVTQKTEVREQGKENKMSEDKKEETPSTTTPPPDRLETKEAFGDASFPDSAFAYVPDEAKGEEGKKSLRKLPHHNEDGSLDEAHVRNGLQQLEKTKDLSTEEKTKIKAHLEAHMKELNPDYEPSESLSTQPPEKIVEKILNVDDTELAKLEKSVQTARGLLQSVEQRLEIMVYGKPQKETKEQGDAVLTDILTRLKDLEGLVNGLQSSVSDLYTRLSEIYGKFPEQTFMAIGGKPTGSSDQKQTVKESQTVPQSGNILLPPAPTPTGCVATTSGGEMKEKLTTRETKLVIREVLKRTPLREVMKHR